MLPNKNLYLVLNIYMSKTLNVIEKDKYSLEKNHALNYLVK
jgi:hypothetical protein